MEHTPVFISYAFVNEQHPDYLFAQQLAKDLRQAGIEVIVDTSNVGEQAFVQRLNTVLPGCQWMIVVLTPEALQSLRLQMSVSSALNLLSEKKMRDIFVLAALPTDPSIVPPTWKNLKLIDASSDYPKALARVLLELEAGISAIASEMRLHSYTFSEQSLNRSASREDDKPSNLPLLFTQLKSDGDRPSSPILPAEISKGGRSKIDVPQPLTASFSVSPGLSPSKLLAFSATIALLLFIVGGGLFYSLSLRKSSDIAKAVTHSNAVATQGIPLASTPKAVVHSPTATPRKLSPTATSRRSSPTATSRGSTPTPVFPNQPTFHEFTLPNSASNPRGIVYGADGNVWFSEDSGSAVGRITPSGSIVTYPVTTQNAYFESKSMAVGPDGNVWFCVSTDSEIGRITPSGQITLYKTPTSNSTPAYITKGPDNNMWFTEGGVNKIGRITTSGTISEFAIPTSYYAGLAGITSGADGNLWFVEYSGNKIGKMTLSGDVTEYVLPDASSFPLAIVNGPDGNLWFAESGLAKIGKITLSGSITEFSIPTSGSSPQGITKGADGNLWFAESSGDKIGKITPGGTITEYQVPTPGSAPNSIIAARDGSLWFTERISGIIGQFIP